MSTLKNENVENSSLDGDSTDKVSTDSDEEEMLPKKTFQSMQATRAHDQIASDEEIETEQKIEVMNPIHTNNNNKNNIGTQEIVAHTPSHRPSRIRNLQKAFDKANKINDEEDDKNNSNKTIPIHLMIIELDRRRAKVKLFTQLLLFLLYFSVYITVLIIQTDSNKGFLLQNAIKNDIIDKFSYTQYVSFKSIININDFWNWFEDIWIDAMYSEKWYSNETLPNSLKHTLGFQTKLIGGFRLQQIRGTYNNGDYCYNSIFSSFAPKCQSLKSDINDIQCDNRINCSTILTFDPFQYRCDTIGNCGFFHDFVFDTNNPNDRSNAELVLSKLKAYRWLDAQTRQIRVLGNFFNNNWKRWISCELILNIDLSGSIITKENIHSIRIELFDSDNKIDVIGMVFTFIYLFLILIFSTYQIRRLIYHRHRLFSHLKETIIPSFFILNNFFIIICYFIYYFHPDRKKLLDLDDQEFSTYRSFQALLNIWDIYVYGHCVNILLATLNLFKFFAVFDAGEAVNVALMDAIPLFLSYIPMYLLSMLGFALSGYVLFGLKYEDWSSIDYAFFSVIEINFGVYNNMTILWNDSQFVGRIFLIITIFTLITFLLNIFLAIVISSWENFLKTKKKLTKIQKYGIRTISTFQTLQAWFYRLPLVQIREDLNLRSNKDYINYSDFNNCCQQLGVNMKYRVIISDWFWPEYHDNSITGNHMESNTNNVNDINNNLDKTNNNMILRPSHPSLQNIDEHIEMQQHRRTTVDVNHQYSVVNKKKTSTYDLSNPSNQK